MLLLQINEIFCSYTFTFTYRHRKRKGRTASAADPEVGRRLLSPGYSGRYRIMRNLNLTTNTVVQLHENTYDQISLNITSTSSRRRFLVFELMDAIGTFGA